MRPIRSLILFLLLLVGFLPLRAQLLIGPADTVCPVRVSLVVCSPSRPFYSLLGHAALRVENTARHTDLIYSYEGTITSTPLWDYVRGAIRSRWCVAPTDTFISHYTAEQRTVGCYPLQLPPRYLRALQDTLCEICMIKSEEYECVTRSCAVSILHLVEQVLAPEHIEYAAWDERFAQTRRRLLTDAILEEGNWWDWLVAQILLPASASEPCRPEDKLCIPVDLLAAWQLATFDGHPLISPE